MGSWGPDLANGQEPQAQKRAGQKEPRGRQAVFMPQTSNCPILIMISLAQDLKTSESLRLTSAHIWPLSKQGSEDTASSASLVRSSHCFQRYCAKGGELANRVRDANWKSVWILDRCVPRGQ